MWTRAQAKKFADGAVTLLSAGWTPDVETTMGGWEACWHKGSLRIVYNSFHKNFVCHHDNGSETFRAQSPGCKHWKDAIEHVRITLALRRNVLAGMVEDIERLQKSEEL